MRPARLAVVVVTLSAGYALSLTGSVPAGAGPRTAPTGIGTHGARTLTLITGDTVRIAGTAGHQQVDVSASPRADGDRPGFTISRRGADVTVIPRDAAGLVPATLDPRLFDVTTLLDHGYDRAGTPLVITYRHPAPAVALPGTTRARASTDPRRQAVRLVPNAATAFARTVDAVLDPATATGPAAATARDIASIRLDSAAGGPVLRGRASDAPMYDVTLDAVARDGRPATGTVQILDVEDGSIAATRVVPGTPGAPCTDAAYAQSSCIRLPAGTYSIMGVLYTMPAGAPSTTKTRTVLNTSLVGNPQVAVTGDTTVPLDARKATRIRAETPAHPDAVANLGGAMQLGFTRTPVTGTPMAFRVSNFAGAQIDENFYEQPTAPVTIGRFSTFSRMRLEQPVLTLAVPGAPAVPLAPRYYDPVWFSDVAAQYPRFSGRARLPVVDVGTATPQEIATHDPRGALALVRRSDAIPVGQQSNNAAAAGARLVAIYNDGPGVDPSPGAIGIRLQVPTVSLSHEDGIALLDRLGARRVTVTGHPASAYLYDLLVRRDGAVPADPTFIADDHSLATVSRQFAGEADSPMTYSDVGYPFQPGETASYSTVYPLLGAPRVRTDYYVADPDVRWSFGVHSPADPYNHLWPEPDAAMDLTSVGSTTFRAGERTSDRWFGAPVLPGVMAEQPLQRAGDVLRVHLNAFTDSAGDWADAYTTAAGFTTNFAMYADDRLVASTTAVPSGLVTVPGGTSRCRIVYTVDNHAPWALMSTHTTSEWTFTSGEPAAGQVRTEPLIVARYDLAGELRNVIRPDAAPIPLGFDVGHQDGATQAPITGVSVDASYDDGRTWLRVPLRHGRTGRYTALIPPRVASHRIGYVSLRVHASDAAGATLTQEAIRAFALSGFVGPT